jgi:hypothetical protein
MPDWHAYVRDHLGPLRLPPGEEQHVAVELGEHLEEFYADLRAQGVGDEEAFARTCARAGDWEELRKGILRATQEEPMHDRIRQIWLPAVVTFISSYVVLALLERAGIHPPFEHPGQGRGVVFYLPWLLLLPFIGATSAYLSRRARGDGWRVYLGASFPVLVLGALFLLLFSIVAALNPHGLYTKATAFGGIMLGWVVLPGCALCAGAALQGLRSRQPTR